MRRTTCLLALAAALPTYVFSDPGQPEPVLAFGFTRLSRPALRDSSGHRHHGRITGPAVFLDAPDGPALAFGGETAVRVQAGAHLFPTDALTLDLWLRWDGPGARGEALHAGGDRYRIAVDAEGALHFGLKSDHDRGDLGAGRLVPGQWHRVTAVFQRPEMTLYLDAEPVGTRTWDHAITPSNTLSLGAKEGQSSFFRGAMRGVRIYAAARPPRPSDTPPDAQEADAAPARLSVTEDDGTFTIDTGPLRFQLDTATASIQSLSVRDKRLVPDHAAPLLFATAMESAEYDGVRDLTDRRMIEARYETLAVRTVREEEAFTAVIDGALRFPGGDTLLATLTLQAFRGGSRIHTRLTLNPEGAFHDRFIREAGLRLPLALNRRKRVVQAADQGLRWDTRHRYEFHMHVDFATTPEFNIWRHFHIDQSSPHAYAIWRSESSETAGLHAFRGRRAPGWMTLYDEEGGVLVGYRGFADRAPKELYAFAEGGGEAVVHLHAPSRPALDTRDPHGAAALFGAPHEMDWFFFEGEEAFEEPERALAEAWGLERFESDGPPQLAPLAGAIDLWSDATPPGGDVPLVAGGLPLPQGALLDANHARLFVRERETPVQASAIAFWPDRSVKWILLVFPLDGQGGYDFEPGHSDGDEIAFRVTLRNDEPVPASLRFGPNVRAGSIAGGLHIRRVDGDKVQIETGPLALTLDTGEHWLPSAMLHGREMLRLDAQPQAFVDYLRTPAPYPVGTTHPEGTEDPGPVHIERIDIEETGPLRAVVRLEGRALSDEPASVVIRIEAYAGKPYVRIFHSVVFEHADPRTTFVRRMGLRFALTDDGALRPDAGTQDGPAILSPAALTGLRQDSHVNYELWEQAVGARHRSLLASAHHSRGWLGARADSAGVAVAVRDMWQDFPKELRLTGGREPALEIGLWPDSVPLMDVRRYSNYPHRAQGESVTWNPEWVLRSYYGDLPGDRATFAEGRRLEPWSGWTFRTDPDDTGLSLGWHRGEEQDGWHPIQVPDWWQNSGAEAANYLGHAWYRTAFSVPEDLAGRDLEIVFEGVDEQGWVYINGEWVGEQSVESTGEAPGALWDRPFTVRVPAERLRPGEENLLAIRVHAGAGLGGLYKPVYIPAPDHATPAVAASPRSRTANREPFAGISRSHELLLVFRDAEDLAPEKIDALVADFQSRPLVHAGWETYARTGIVMPLADPADPAFHRFYENMNRVARWWLFHQKAYGWYGLWDHGDVQHRYRSGYGRIFPPDELARILALPPADRTRINLREYRQIQDYHPQNDWAHDNGRWGWGNTEGLPNYTMSLQYLLTGERDLFFFVEANARHSRDVVARHSGTWFGRGTRHGVQHWSCGNHEERQTTFTEQRFHYLLTGEHRTREWNRALTEQYYLTTACGNHAAHSGRSYGLLFRWELTGDPVLGEILQRYMRTLATPEGLAVNTTVRFPEAEPQGPPDQLHGESMFFHTFGAMHAVLDYYYLTGDEQVHDSILRTAEHLLATRPGTDPGMMRKVLAFAARHAPDPEPFTEWLRSWTAGPGYRFVFQQVPANPQHWYGENSFIMGNVSGGLFWFMDASYVLGALGREPTPTAEQEAEMARIEERPVIPRPRLPREAWQSEYDRPEFEDYFRDPMVDLLPH